MQGSEIWNWAKELRDTLRREEAVAFADAPSVQNIGSRGASASTTSRKSLDSVAQAEEDDDGDSCRVKGQPVGRPRGKTAVSQRLDCDDALDDAGDDGNSSTPAPGRPRGRRASGIVQGTTVAPVAPSKDGRKRRREDD
jgi:hypothetical protein